MCEVVERLERTVMSPYIDNTKATALSMLLELFLSKYDIFVTTSFLEDLSKQILEKNLKERTIK